MAGLIAGGLEAVWSRSRTERIASRLSTETFELNPELYEMDARQAARLDYREAYRGKLVKLFKDHTFMGPASRYPIVTDWARAGDRVLFMVRGYDAWQASTEAAFGGARARRLTWSRSMFAAIDRLRQIGAEVRVVWFEWLLEAPGAVFADLARAGWPICPAAAAIAVRPELRRF